jgi:hypothetical protein
MVSWDLNHGLMGIHWNLTIRNRDLRGPELPKMGSFYSPNRD